MTGRYTGIVRGQTILLDQPLDLPDGTRVMVEVVAWPATAQASVADANPMSPSRAMSADERAALEEVYQDRGCSATCDE